MWLNELIDSFVERKTSNWNAGKRKEKEKSTLVWLWVLESLLSGLRLPLGCEKERQLENAAQTAGKPWQMIYGILWEVTSSDTEE